MESAERILERLGRGAIGAIGDSVADIYILGRPERISREAPVMVVRKEEERLIPGCAANTLNNLLALGCRALPVTGVGDDEAGGALKKHFASRGVPMEGILTLPGYRTVTKTRIMVGDANRIKHQVIRIDHEPQPRVPPAAEAEVLKAVEKIDRAVDAWLVSDYSYFLVSDRVASRLLDIARRKTVVVDSRHRLGLFKGVRCVTPNESEAEAAARAAIRDDRDAVEVGSRLRRELEADSLVLTRGNKGMILFESSGAVEVIPAVGSEEVVDVSGAGDTVAATLTACLVAGATVSQAARLANCAASVVVMKPGAATCSADELRARLAAI